MNSFPVLLFLVLIAAAYAFHAPYMPSFPSSSRLNLFGRGDNKAAAPGGGGFGDMLKNAQEIAKKMENANKELSVSALP